MADEGGNPNELIVIGVILIVLGIIMLVTLSPHEMRVKRVIGSFVVPAFGIVSLIVGLVRKFRKPNR